MSRSLSRASLGLVVAASLALGCQGGEKMERIPLSSIYATTSQQDVKEADRGDTNVQALLGKSSYGASNVFLVSGKDIGAAVKATKDVFFAWQPVDAVLLPKEEEKRQLWLVVFFGFSGSDLPKWTVETVERSQEKVRLIYRTGEPETLDMHGYFAWVALPRINSGMCTLELVDSRMREPTLVRRVRIKEQETN